MFLFKQFLSLLLLPPGLPLLLMALGLTLMKRRPRMAFALAWGGLAGGVLFSSAWSVALLLGPLEDIPTLSARDAAGAQAIVILAGGRTRHAPEYGGENVNRLTLERVRYGARLSRQTGLPVLVSGGAVGEGRSEGGLMKEALERDFHVPVRWLEDRSRDTRENARNTAAMLRPLGIRRVVLVSHAAHLKRAESEFRAVGLEPVLAPTAFLGKRALADDELVWADYLPSAAAAYAGWYAGHEWLGILAQRVSGIR